MRVFVLGGTGTVGTAIVSELVDRNHQVVALSRSEKSDQKLATAGAVPLRGDLSDPGIRLPDRTDTSHLHWGVLALRRNWR